MSDQAVETNEFISVKEAIRIAKTGLADWLEGEAFQQLGLEEVKFDERAGRWLITLGLNRPWNKETQQSGSYLGMPSGSTTRQIRTYKKVEINGRTGEIVSLTGTD